MSLMSASLKQSLTTRVSVVLEIVVQVGMVASKVTATLVIEKAL